MDSRAERDQAGRRLVGAGEPRDLVTGSDELGDDGGASEARAACDEEMHGDSLAGQRNGTCSDSPVC